MPPPVVRLLFTQYARAKAKLKIGAVRGNLGIVSQELRAGQVELCLDGTTTISGYDSILLRAEDVGDFVFDVTCSFLHFITTSPNQPADSPLPAARVNLLGLDCSLDDGLW